MKAQEMTHTQKKQIESARQQDHDLVRANQSGQLSRQWMRVQENMFTAGLTPQFYASVQAELDRIAELRDDAEAREWAAWERLTKAA